MPFFSTSEYKVEVTMNKATGSIAIATLTVNPYFGWTSSRFDLGGVFPRMGSNLLHDLVELNDPFELGDQGVVVLQ